MSHWPSISKLADDVNSGKQSALNLVEQALTDLEGRSEYKTVIAATKDRAIDRAKQVDNQVKTGKPAGRLAGVPFIAKDNLLAFGADTTAASNILKGFNAPYQATAINKLEDQGAICIAKANLDAFGHGSSTENSDFFITLNPVDKTRVPGGSSGGSAASVALDIVPFALGTDTGGSLRQPASFSGVIGYKPSYGRVSRSGVVAMASSADTVGAITKTVDDLALVIDVISGRDDLDSTTIEKEESFTELKLTVANPRVGIIKEYFDEGLDDGVRRSVTEATDKLAKLGAVVEEVSLPSLPLALAVYYILCPAEIASNLSRYDGQRFGYSAKDASTLEDSYLRSRSEGFGAEAKRRIMIGTYVLSSGYYDAYYKRAQTVRSKLIAEFKEAFKNYDFLVGPTATTTAFKIGQFTSDPLAMYLNDIMTVAANLTGIPAIVLPATPADGLPVGLQLMAPYGQDAELLAYSKHVEEILSV